MRVSTKELFNLISKADTKDVKKALEKIVSNKEGILADEKNIGSDKIKNQTTKELVNSLLKDLSSNTKTKENVLSTLKENDIPKMMKNTTVELKSLLDLVKSDKTLAKFAPALEKLLLHVKEIKPETLKTQLSNTGLLLESKLATSKTEVMPTPLKEVLTNLKELVVKSFPKQEIKELPLKQIDTLLSAKKADKSFIDTLSSLIKNIKNAPDLLKEVQPQIKTLENILKQDTPIPQTNIKEVLTNLKQSLTQNTQNSDVHVKIIDKLLNTPKADKVFIDDIKSLIANLKTSKNINKPVVEVTAKLETLVQKSTLIESKIQNISEVAPKEVQKVANEIKQVMTELKELSLSASSKKAPAILEKSQTIVQMVDQTLKTPEFFPKELSKATISEQIQRVVNLIKSELVKVDAKNPLHVEVAKLTEKLELTIKEQIASKNIVPNQKLLLDTPIKSEGFADTKATLLSMKHELSTSTLPSAKEALIQVDRLLTRIDYFQLVSLGSNSNTTYLPYVWDGLQEGQVSIKKLKENRFFCEINLKLKEYGKIDLMLMLFEDIHVNISVFAEKKEFVELVQENMQTLKQGLNKLGLVPSNIKLYDALKDKKLKEDTRDFASSRQLGSSINIEV
ncbi:flagellar hook-length control protein FliK [Sulfurospirillum arcachonense]|uniref:flagellar hook-length control protein FliK n=1 Tax=Sulfurospirillum arcachonense TaxID=57666 RepID=UPI000468121A|nr:flagellar hook-length control protein FliK [Sulfurospirillum arcachonense]